MPFVHANNVDIYYEDSAPNDSSKPVLLFAHGLLWSTQLYDKQVEYFSKDYRCICFDFRGQGKTQITESGYDMDTLTEDTVALIHQLGIKGCHFIGLSMGGFIGMRLAIRYPELLSSLMLLETSADPEPLENVPKYNALLKAIKWLGLKRVSKKVMPIMFGQTFLTDKARKTEYKLWKKRLENNNKQSIIKATRGVIDRQGVYDELHNINTPTLILVGDEDVATRYEKSERMHLAINNSKLLIIANAGHSSAVEEPEQVNRAIQKFLDLQYSKS